MENNKLCKCSHYKRDHSPLKETGEGEKYHNGDCHCSQDNCPCEKFEELDVNTKKTN